MYIFSLSRFTYLFFIISITNSQFISMKTCSDLYCNTNCKSWIASNNQCTDTTPYSITTLSSFATYSDSNCNTLVSNTYKTPIMVDGSCYQLYLYGNLSPTGSYTAINISSIIGISIGSLFLMILLSICILKCYGYNICCCCCYKRYIPPPQQTNAIILDSNTYISPYPNITYGYPVIIDYGQKPYYPQPVYPQQNYPIYNNQNPPKPSAPEHYNII